jgi:septum site-determining protein MinD
LLLDSPAALGSKSAVLPVVLADRIVAVLAPTIPALSDGLKVQEYARSYGTGGAGVLFNKVRDRAAVERIRGKTERYFDGPVLASVPDTDRAREARRAGQPLLAHAPESTAAAAYREAADAIEVRHREEGRVARRFESAVVPDTP